MLQKIEKQGENIIVTLGRSSATLTAREFSEHKMVITQYEKAIELGNDGVELDNEKLSSFKVLATALKEPEKEEGEKEEAEGKPSETPKPPGRKKKKDKAGEATEATHE